jgi:hypothetical protein
MDLYCFFFSDCLQVITYRVINGVHLNYCNTPFKPFPLAMLYVPLAMLYSSNISLYLRYVPLAMLYLSNSPLAMVYLSNAILYLSNSPLAMLYLSNSPLAMLYLSNFPLEMLYLGNSLAMLPPSSFPLPTFPLFCQCSFLTYQYKWVQEPGLLRSH